MASNSGTPVVHRSVALLMCENATVLKEILAQIDLSDTPHRRLGDRAIVAPSDRVEQLRELLNERGMYPRLVGDVPTRGEELEEGSDVDEEEE